MSQLRPDLAVIASLIAPGSRVLDIGCGDGELLHWLRADKKVDGRGIEIDQQLVHQAIARGITDTWWYDEARAARLKSR